MTVVVLLAIQGKAIAEEPAVSEPSSGTNTTEAQEGTTAPDPIAADFGPPKLLYLAWQEDGLSAVGEPIEHIVWDADGEILDLKTRSGSVSAVETNPDYYLTKNRVQDQSFGLQ